MKPSLGQADTKYLTEAEASRTERIRSLLRRASKTWGAYLYLMPTLVGLIFLRLGPVLASLGLSFTNWRAGGRWEWVGLDNYERLLHAREFGAIMRNTFYYAVGTTVLVVTLSLALALLTTRKLRGISLFRSAYFMPYVMPIVPVALAWTWLLQPQFGYINYFLWKFLHIKGPLWLDSYTWALPSLILVATWQGVGYYSILFTAGLLTIPKELYEAAIIDGAGAWARFRRITLPLLSPTTFFVMIMAIIDSFHVFGSIYIMTDGGPGISTLVLSYAIYQYAFNFGKMGYASAMAWLLSAIVFILTLIQMRLQRLWVFQGY